MEVPGAESGDGPRRRPGHGSKTRHENDPRGVLAYGMEVFPKEVIQQQ